MFIKVNHNLAPCHSGDASAEDVPLWCPVASAVVVATGAFDSAVADGRRITEVTVEGAEPRFPGGPDHELCALLGRLTDEQLLRERK